MGIKYQKIVEWFYDDRNRKRILILHGGLLFLYVLFFYVIAESGFTADDMYNSNVLGLKYMADNSIWALTKSAFISWVKAGRFFPFSDYVYIMFYFIPSRLIYKLMIIISIYINSILFYKCVEKISHSKVAALFTLLFFPMCLQLTPEFDSAFYCFHMLVQMTFIWSLLSLYCVLKYIDKRREKQQGEKAGSRYVYLILSGVFLFISLGTYEVAFVLVIFIGLGVWAYSESFKDTLKVLIPDFVAYGLAGFITLVLRMHVTDVGYDGVAINLNPVIVLKTFSKQLYSTLPLSRYIYRTLRGDTPFSKVDLLGNLRWTDLFLVIIFIAGFLLITSLMKKQINHIENYRFLVIGGCSLLLLPALLISITTKYQDSLEWGTSHITCYIQSFGLVLVVMCLYVWILKKAKPKSANIITAVILIISVPVLLAQQMEARTAVFYINQSHRYSVENIEKAGNIGVFDQIEPEDYVYGLSAYYYDLEDSKTFYSKYSKREISISGGEYLFTNVLEMNAKLTGQTTPVEQELVTVDTETNDNEVYTIQSENQGKEGYVVVSHITSYTIDSVQNKECTFYADSIRIYTDFSTEFTVSYMEDGESKELSSSELSVEKESQGSDQRIYSLEGLNVVVNTLAIVR